MAGGFGLLFAFVLWCILPPIPKFFLILIFAVPIFYLAFALVNAFFPPIYLIGVAIILVLAGWAGWVDSGSGKRE